MYLGKIFCFTLLFTLLYRGPSLALRFLLIMVQWFFGILSIILTLTYFHEGCLYCLHQLGLFIMDPLAIDCKREYSILNLDTDKREGRISQCCKASPGVSALLWSYRSDWVLRSHSLPCITWNPITLRFGWFHIWVISFSFRTFHFMRKSNYGRQLPTC